MNTCMTTSDAAGKVRTLYSGLYTPISISGGIFELLLYKKTVVFTYHYRLWRLWNLNSYSSVFDLPYLINTPCRLIWHQKTTTLPLFLVKINRVSAPMKISDYLTGYCDLLDSKQVAEIKRHSGAIPERQWCFKTRIGKNYIQRKSCGWDVGKFEDRRMMKVKCSGRCKDMPSVRAYEDVQ